MPKANKVRRSRGPTSSSKERNVSPLESNKHNKQSKRQDNNASNEVPTRRQAEDGLSRGQRKRNAKKEQYLRRENMILSTLALRRKDEQKKRIDGLDALKEALNGVLTRTASKASTSTSSKHDEGKRNEKKPK